MCYEVKCSACGKSTWAGCGRHVQSVYKRIQEDQRCLCREWPGISNNNSTADASPPSSICTIL